MGVPRSSLLERRHNNTRRVGRGAGGKNPSFTRNPAGGVASCRGDRWIEESSVVKAFLSLFRTWNGKKVAIVIRAHDGQKNVPMRSSIFC